MNNSEALKLVQKLERLSDEILLNANNSWDEGYSWGLQKAANIISINISLLEEKF